MPQCSVNNRMLSYWCCVIDVTVVMPEMSFLCCIINCAKERCMFTVQAVYYFGYAPKMMFSICFKVYSWTCNYACTFISCVYRLSSGDSLHKSLNNIEQRSCSVTFLFIKVDLFFYFTEGIVFTILLGFHTYRLNSSQISH